MLLWIYIYMPHFAEIRYRSPKMNNCIVHITTPYTCVRVRSCDVYRVYDSSVGGTRIRKRHVPYAAGFSRINRARSARTRVFGLRDVGGDVGGGKMIWRVTRDDVWRGRLLYTLRRHARTFESAYTTHGRGCVCVRARHFCVLVCFASRLGHSGTSMKATDQSKNDTLSKGTHTQRVPAVCK